MSDIIPEGSHLFVMSLDGTVREMMYNMIAADMSFVCCDLPPNRLGMPASLLVAIIPRELADKLHPVIEGMIGEYYGES